jgi:hypothetical protein
MGAFFGMQERPKQEYYTSSGALTSSYAQGGPVSFDEGGTSRLGDYFRSKVDKYEIDRQINALMAEKNKYRLDYLGSYTP